MVAFQEIYCDNFFTNQTILLSEEISSIFEYYIHDKIELYRRYGPKMCASFNFSNTFQITKFAKLKTHTKFPLYNITAMELNTRGDRRAVSLVSLSLAFYIWSALCLPLTAILNIINICYY